MCHLLIDWYGWADMDGWESISVLTTWSDFHSLQWDLPTGHFTAVVQSGQHGRSIYPET